MVVVSDLTRDWNWNWKHINLFPTSVFRSIYSKAWAIFQDSCQVLPPYKFSNVAILAPLLDLEKQQIVHFNEVFLWTSHVFHRARPNRRQDLAVGQQLPAGPSNEIESIDQLCQCSASASHSVRQEQTGPHPGSLLICLHCSDVRLCALCICSSRAATTQGSANQQWKSQDKYNLKWNFKFLHGI